MSPESDQLAVLHQMRDEGRITDEQYEDLASGLLGLVDDAIDTDSEVEEDETTAADSDPDANPLLPPSFRDDLSVNYLGVLFLASVVLLFASSVGPLSWLLTTGVLLVLITTLFKGWQKVTITTAAIVAAVVVIGLAGAVGDSPQSDQPNGVILPPVDPYPPIPGSLGIYMGQVTDLWNTVDGPPRITQGLTRQNETGEYDTFLYRFGEWGRLAGAYDPGNEAIYALLITGQIVSNAATDQLYLHLCFMVAPYSQDCIDTYHREGLNGGTLEDFIDIPHQAEWTVGEHEWRMQIDQNVLTVRVYGEDAA